MSTSEKTDPLFEWNRLNRENAEQCFASALFSSMAQTSPIVDKFPLWLLGGTGASGALLISQIKSILPYLTARGFKLSLVFLVVSAVFGFLAKYRSLRCQIQTEMEAKLIALMEGVFEKHEEDEKRIEEYTKQRDIELKTGIDFSNVIREFVEPFPLLVSCLIFRQIDKSRNNRQAGYHVAINCKN